MALLLATLRLWTPLVFAALGGTLSERSGVIALGLEGMMLAGAFAAVAGAQLAGGWFGVFAGILAGAFVGMLHGFGTQYLRVPGVLSGVALNLGVVGLTTFAVRLQPTGMMTKSTIPGEILTIFALILSVALYFLLYQTPLGLRLRASGENRKAVQSAGLPLRQLRWGAVIVSGALAGLGGVALSLPGLGEFTENMTAGRGYIALATVIFGRWNPLSVALAALVFGFGDALQLNLQTAGLAKFVPPDVLNLLPYLLTLIILTVRRGTNNAPADL